ncbi:MAG: hypothetical protein PVI54_02605, partial [Desulfobacteraceae bacterium]
MNRFILPITLLTLCIGAPFASATQTDPGDGYTVDQCVACHEEMAQDHGHSVHRSASCLQCHQEAVDEAHEQLPPPPVDCGRCHAPHDEKVAHDPHTRIACKACHQKDGVAVADPESGRVIFSGETVPGRNL